MVTGTNTSWHTVLLWGLGAIALLALADKAPNISTMLLLVIILGILLKNWPVYKTWLNVPSTNGSTTNG